MLRSSRQNEGFSSRIQGRSGYAIEQSSIVHRIEEEFLTADKTGFSQIIEREEVLEPLILSVSCFICG
jgi:hypothetical protein